MDFEKPWLVGSLCLCGLLGPCVQRNQLPLGLHESGLVQCPIPDVKQVGIRTQIPEQCMKTRVEDADGKQQLCLGSPENGELCEDRRKT